MLCPRDARDERFCRDYCSWLSPRTSATRYARHITARTTGCISTRRACACGRAKSALWHSHIGPYTVQVAIRCFPAASQDSGDSKPNLRGPSATTFAILKFNLSPFGTGDWKKMSAVAALLGNGIGTITRTNMDVFIRDLLQLTFAFSLRPAPTASLHRARRHHRNLKKSGSMLS